jgi:hypothetical protein
LSSAGRGAIRVMPGDGSARRRARRSASRVELGHDLEGDDGFSACCGARPLEPGLILGGAPSAVDRATRSAGDAGRPHRAAHRPHGTGHALGASSLLGRAAAAATRDRSTFAQRSACLDGRPLVTGGACARGAGGVPCAGRRVWRRRVCCAR